MLSCTILCVGSLKENYWKQAEQEYLKRLKPFAKITIQEIKEEAFKSPADSGRVLAQEEKRIMPHLQSGIIMLLDREGKNYSSEEFANTIESQTQHGEHLVFVIGGPLGVSESIKKMATKRLSFSALTFTHQIARILLEEQLYRASTILSGKQYHY